MSRRSRINAVDALKIKEMLWQGTLQQDVARHFGVSQATISRIQNGAVWALIKWPDGNMGALPPEREHDLIALRYPGIAVRNIIANALESGVDTAEIAQRVKEAIEEKETKERQELIDSVKIPESDPIDETEVQTPRIKLISAKEWAVIKKNFDPKWWEAVDPKDRIMQTAVHNALLGEGASKMPEKAIRRAIDDEVERIQKQQSS